MTTIDNRALEGQPSSSEESQVYRLILDGTVSETGTEFFRALVRNMSRALGTIGAWVTEYLPEEKRLRALAMWLNGKYVNDFVYAISGTACERVVESRSMIHIPDRLIELFPADTDLIPLKALSYLGAPILDGDGSVLGHLSVLDNKPMPRRAELISLFELFATRAAAEHRRLRVEEDLRAQREQLELLVQSTLDAILVLDSELAVTRVNVAAERLFGCTSEDLVGERIEEFLVDESASRLGAVTREIHARPRGKQQLWIPQNFVARRWDHTVFPAEATVSRFETRQKTFYTVILRNSDERLEAERQIQLLTQEAEFLRAERGTQGDLLGRSHAMQVVFEAIRQVAKTISTVLILGETGTGKELVARAIHRASLRAEKPLVTVNCAAIPANLLESEFFGHERGAFTGALTKREGRFAFADGGTIFLDEIGELPLDVQAKLLRVLQEGEFEPLGSTKTRKVDVRILVATHRDLQKMCKEGTFREDLYFRLNVFPIRTPPLRERSRDIELLAEAFAQRFAWRTGKRIHALSEQHRRLLHSYHWPGNVRELQNIIERAIILTEGPDIQLQVAMAGMGPIAPAPEPERPTGPARVLTAEQFLELERDNITQALECCNWKVAGTAGAAQLLGVPPTTLNSRMKALGVQRPSASV